MKIITILLLSLLLSTPVMAASDAARLEGDLKVKGIHFSGDGTVLTTAPKDGKSVLNGSGPPTIVGNVGDFYIDTTNNRLYGPYVGSWGAGVSLVGPQGSQGIQGPQGPVGQVTLTAMCAAIKVENVQLPSFCPLNDAWLAKDSPVAQSLSGVVWAATQFVAVGKTGTILASTDGTSWEKRISGTTEDLNSVAWSGTKFVVVGGFNGNILTSTDGITWSKTSTGVIKYLRRVIWANNKFVAVGMGTILTSSDGTAWTQRTVNTTSEISNVVWTGSKYVAIGGSNGAVCFTSTDGITWTSQSGLTSAYSGMFFGLTWSGSQLIATGWAGTIVASSDGITWAKYGYGSNLLSAATWANNRYIAVGDKGTILTSSNGNTWTAATSNNANALNGIDCSNTTCVAVGGTTGTSTILVNN